LIHTLRLRLTLWYAGLFGLMALAVFVIASYMVSYQAMRVIDIDLQDTAQEFVERLKTGGREALQTEIDNETASHGEAVFFARYLDAKGKPLAGHSAGVWGFNLPEPDHSRTSAQWFSVGAGMRGGPVRLLILPVAGLGWIEVGLSLVEYESQIHQIRAIFGVSLLFMVLLGVMAGWVLLRKVFGSVEQVRRAAADISDGALDRRVALAGEGRELADLADAFNTMLDRIQRLLGEMRDVNNHIAHDLRTPVARIRGLAETGLLAGNADPSRRDEILATIVEECDQLGAMINTMLEIAQTDAGLIHQQHEIIHLDKVLAEAHDLFLPVAEDAGISLHMNIPSQDIRVSGNKARLQRAIANLIDNALKFSRAGGHVSITAEIQRNAVDVRIRDDGIGISGKDLPHIFERFYRSDQSRSQPGNGLGLSYAMSIVRSHGGNIDVASMIGSGSTFTICLPLSGAHETQLTAHADNHA